MVLVVPVMLVMVIVLLVVLMLLPVSMVLSSCWCCRVSGGVVVNISSLVVKKSTNQICHNCSLSLLNMCVVMLCRERGENGEHGSLFSLRRAASTHHVYCMIAAESALRWLVFQVRVFTVQKNT